MLQRPRETARSRKARLNAAGFSSRTALARCAMSYWIASMMSIDPRRIHILPPLLRMPIYSDSGEFWPYIVKPPFPCRAPNTTGLQIARRKRRYTCEEERRNCRTEAKRGDD
jgi:hypothetical protein